jgi:hypothetical protein
MNDVVGEAGERALAAIAEDFHFVGGGVTFDAVEDFGGLVFG